MKIILKQETRVLCKAGNVIEVDEAQAAYLISLGLAEVEKKKAEAKKSPAKKTTKKGE